MTPMNARIPAITIALSLLATPLPPAVASGDQDMITRLCMAGFNGAMASAGKTPPAGMGEYTCKCFLDEVNAGASVQTAQDSCKQKAAERYKL